MPLGQERHHVGVDPVDVARRVLREHHLLGVTPPDHLEQGGRPRFERGVEVDAEPVHAEHESRICESGQVVAVGRVTAVTEHDPRWVDALLVTHHPFHLEPGLRAGVGVHGDRHTGREVGLGDSAHHPLDACCHALLVDSALQHPGPHPGAGDPFADVADEHLDHRLRQVGAEHSVERGAAIGEVSRRIVVGVDARRHHQLDRNLLHDPLDTRDVAAETDHGRVDDGANAGVVRRLEPLDCLRDPGVLVAPLLGVVGLHVRGEDEDVLVHQGDAEVGGVHRPPDCLDRDHAVPKQSAPSDGKSALEQLLRRRRRNVASRGPL